MTSRNTELRQAHDELLNATTALEILNGVIACHHYQVGEEGEPPQLHKLSDFAPYDPVQTVHDTATIDWETIKSLPFRHFRDALGFEGPAYEVPELVEAHGQVRAELDGIDKTIAELSDDEQARFQHSLRLDDWIGFFRSAVLIIDDFSKRIERIHLEWVEALRRVPNFRHPLAPALEVWAKEKSAKHITNEHDKKRSAAIITNPMGSVREINFTEMGDAQLREFATPERISQVNPDQMRLGFDDEPPSRLPDIMPLEVPTPEGVKPTTRKGAVSHVIRIFYEALMALEPHEWASDIAFRLGDLIKYLNPDGKFHRATQLPYIIDALETLHIHATLPWIDDTGEMRKWRPVWVKSPLSMDSQDDAPVHMRVEVPPDARQGYMILKQIHRMLGKKSGPQFNAYHTISWIWDKHATVKGTLIDPTRPVDRRNEKGEIVDKDGKPILTARGKPITYLYHERVLAQDEREDNPAADKKYPVLSKNDLIAACMPKATNTNPRVLWQRAKKYWEGLEHMGIIRIKREKNGWTIFPSQEHLAAYRGVSEASKKKA